MAQGHREGELVGHTLGHYTLLALLGTGGMAEVYRARDLALPREVAVKVLPSSLAADPSYIARFRSEARRVGTLRHPNIVSVFEFGEHDGLLYLVMPLAPHSLRDRLLRADGTAPLPIADALAVAIQVASALEAAHAQGIVHRDVKPENILLDRDGHALLTDFGIARELAFLRRAGAVQTLAATGLPVGTPEYMAPEQLRNGPIDQRADVYALGAVLYELLCGVAPHEASTPYEVAALALTAPITPPSVRNPRVWPELEAAVLTALASDASDRFSSMTEFAVALRAASKRNTGLLGLRGGVRATLPIFRKTALVDPYEGPTGQILATGLAGLTGRAPVGATDGARRRLLPTTPGRPRRAQRPARRVRKRAPHGKRRAALVALLMVVALLVVGSAGALLRSGRLDALIPTRVVYSSTATPAPTYTPLPTYTPRPTETPTRVPTVTPIPPPPPTATPIPSGSGLSGSYYQGTEPSGSPAHQRVDGIIYFPDWASSPPYPDMPNDFSVVWTGRLRAQQSGTFKISTLSDDGVQVVIDNIVLIDDWTDHGVTTDSGSITLTAGQFYAIRVMYYQHLGGATMELSWLIGSQQQQIIPQSALYPS